jgi:hypothetical protein
LEHFGIQNLGLTRVLEYLQSLAPAMGSDGGADLGLGLTRFRNKSDIYNLGLTLVLEHLKSQAPAMGSDGGAEPQV